uniref:Uncharacterized protein n=1 Tax=Anopheles coluzzii TaxID=1518534 RepID=A0A8W7PWN2_ANOCL
MDDALAWGMQALRTVAVARLKETHIARVGAAEPCVWSGIFDSPQSTNAVGNVTRFWSGNGPRSGYYRKRCFAAVRNLCKLRSGDKTHSKFNPTGAGRPSEPAAVGNGIAEAQQRPGGIGYGRPAPKAYPKPYRAS